MERIEKSSGLSIEKQLVCAAASDYVCGRPGKHLATLMGQDPEWSDVLMHVRRQGLAPILLSQLKQVQSTKEVPERILSELKQLWRHQLRNNLQKTNELLDLVHEFEREGIPVIPFKGPVLATMLYGDVGVRTSKDLDLFLHRRDIQQAKEILLARGYERNQKLSHEDEKEFLHNRLAYEFVKPDSRSKVELHWALLPLHNASTIPPDLVWKDHTHIRLGGKELRSIHTRLLLPYLCAHASKHCWAKLKWIIDIALLIKSCSEEEINDARRLATEFGCERMLHVGFILTDRIMGVSVPDPVMDTVAADEAAKELADDVLSHWLLEATPEDERFVQSFWFHFRERERWRDRLPFIRHNLWLLLNPTEKDQDLVRLPKYAEGLYFLLRPFRIVKDRLIDRNRVA